MSCVYPRGNFTGFSYSCNPLAGVPSLSSNPIKNRKLLPLDKESKLKLDVQIRVIDRVTILHCRGRLTYREEARAFSETIATVISDCPQVVIEMSGLEAIDSAGLGELAVIHMWARASGCALKLAGASARLQQLFELTNLRSIFETYSTLDDALGSYRESLQTEVAGSAA